MYPDDGTVDRQQEAAVSSEPGSRHGAWDGCPKRLIFTQIDLLLIPRPTTMAA